MQKIKIKKSSKADTRTCNWADVSKDELLNASRMHIKDVRAGMNSLANEIIKAANNHDWDKIHDIGEFYRDFQTGFKRTVWWDKHRKVNRHHIDKPDGFRDDVNLIDVMEYIVDCVTAGMARSGVVYDLKLDSELLQKAFTNTCELVKNNVELED